MQSNSFIELFGHFPLFLSPPLSRQRRLAFVVRPFARYLDDLHRLFGVSTTCRSAMSSLLCSHVLDASSARSIYGCQNPGPLENRRHVFRYLGFVWMSVTISTFHRACRSLRGKTRKPGPKPRYDLAREEIMEASAYHVPVAALFRGQLDVETDALAPASYAPRFAASIMPGPRNDRGRFPERAELGFLNTCRAPTCARQNRDFVVQLVQEFKPR